MFHRIAAALIGVALLLPVPAQAWGFYAHSVTAQIAEANISPHGRREIARLLRYEALLGTPECRMRTLSEAAVWADCVRRDGWRWGFTAAWHYRTTPICEAYNPRANCSGGNCVTAQIERAHRMLADERLPAHIRLEALAFMVHFAGDIHMPLHSGDKDDRGGNDREASYGIVPGMNLHWIWDGALAERAITSGPDEVIRRYSAQERAELAGGTPADWGRESWQIARDFVYPNAFDRDACAGDLPDETALTQEDIVEAVPVARRRVQQAGLRIADLLESAFAPGPLPQPERERR
ncbi:S1/P1 nuclease [Altererythrobacter sp. BO-6]|uniref:S1/P1 nuclease n=1 Tax=Altererythrobacter sp. BO-6 TaxID=2604537 RepID=UPI0013E15A88|nr:S1/P1 nuclease [Altererythrobacter sp. BO-6]QIG55374.1 S1/P1 nuclease [Altererythrobacter sp. BO-6]